MASEKSTITDIDRWSKLANSAVDPVWANRNDVIVSYIPENSNVLDIGAGNMTLKKLLPNGCQYQPMDCVIGDDSTIVHDFNSTDDPPMLHGFDVVVCSGVLEYINDPLMFLNTIKTYGTEILLSYALYDDRSIASKRNPSINGWVNSFTINDMLNFFYICGLQNTLDSVVWNKHTIFKLTKLETQ